MYDITALGELLIDFTPAGHSMQGNVLFERNPGGAPANVLAAMTKFGRKASFIGKVGKDAFGRYLREVLIENHIEARGLIASDEASTTMAFVHLNPDGDRTFSFSRKPGADQLLRKEEVDYDLIRQSSILHFGSLSLTHEPSRSATWDALKYAKSRGIHISYDPNLRVPLWDSLSDAKQMMLQGMTYADIVKISEEELFFLTGTADLEAGTKQLQSIYKLPLILVTMGAEGSYYRRGELCGRIPGFPVQSVDTTGAGDAFLGGWLHAWLELKKPINELGAEELQESLRFANATGACTTLRKGAIPALPSLSDVHQLMQWENSN